VDVDESQSLDVGFNNIHHQRFPENCQLGFERCPKNNMEAVAPV
jgi:hypothetical protein